jgi:hypothetical protein
LCNGKHPAPREESYGIAVAYLSFALANSANYEPKKLRCWSDFVSHSRKGAAAAGYTEPRLFVTSAAQQIAFVATIGSIPGSAFFDSVLGPEPPEKSGPETVSLVCKGLSAVQKSTKTAQFGATFTRKSFILRKLGLRGGDGGIRTLGTVSRTTL